MLVTLDIGNSNITFGVFAVERSAASPRPVKMWRMSTDARRTSDEYGAKMLDFLHYAMLSKEDVVAVAVSSVVPALNRIISAASADFLGRVPVIFDETHFRAARIAINVDNPSEVGADRIMNALAVSEFFGAPSIAVDFGTALTFDCVGKKGDYVGGVILPGPLSAAESLAGATAKLPKVELCRPARVVGKNTVECIQSGIWRGYVAMVKRFIKDIKSEIGASARVVATGGLAGQFAKDIKEINAFVPELTLEGVRILWNKVRK